MAIPAVAFVYRSVTFPRAPEVRDERAAGLPSRYWLLWSALLLFVAVEFCIAFWATDYPESERGFGESAAAASASLLLVGMTTGRVAGGWLAKRFRTEPLLTTAVGVAAVGFVVFWLVDVPAPTLVGLAVAGLGISLLYPLTLALAIEASGGRTDAASARRIRCGNRDRGGVRARCRRRPGRSRRRLCDRAAAGGRGAAVLLTARSRGA